MKAVDAPKHASRIHQIAQSSEVLIQPFLPEVETEGEWSFLFFGGEFSHAILKKPAPGNFLVQAEHGGSVIPVKARQEWVRTARSVLDLVSTPLLYARVDMIQVSGELVLGELEITEPALYLEYDSNAAERFASAFRRFRN